MWVREESGVKEGAQVLRPALNKGPVSLTLMKVNSISKWRHSLMTIGIFLPIQKLIVICMVDKALVRFPILSKGM
jgi:hypothetical protein